MAKAATKSARAPAKAAPVTNTPESEKAGPVDETLSSTGRSEGSGGNSEAPKQPTVVDVGGGAAQPEPVEGATPPDSGATGRAVLASEAGQASGGSSAAAIPDAASHPAIPLIEEARASRGPADDGPAAEPGGPIRRNYPVRSPLRHDRRRYSPDDPEANAIDLTEAEAETLIAIGVLGEPL